MRLLASVTTLAIIFLAVTSAQAQISTALGQSFDRVYVNPAPVDVSVTPTYTSPSRAEYAPRYRINVGTPRLYWGRRSTVYHFQDGWQMTITPHGASNQLPPVHLAEQATHFEPIHGAGIRQRPTRTEYTPTYTPPVVEVPVQITD